MAMPSLTDDVAHHPATASGYPLPARRRADQRILFIIRTQTRAHAAAVQVLRHPSALATIVVFLPAPTRHLRT